MSGSSSIHFSIQPAATSVLEAPSLIKRDHLAYEKFATSFQLGELTTEQANEKTKNLSQTMKKDIPTGLMSLHSVDQDILPGMERFVNTHAQDLSSQLNERISAGGRVFLVGAGSSGRIAIDLAAKWQKIAEKEWKERVIGVIAGGDRAIIRPKEGFEDSENDGFKTLESYRLTDQDTVINISASGSATFNVGAAKAALAAGSKVYYFYNSTVVPARTAGLFDKGVIPLLVAIDPQAITGSTRLQAASVAAMALGAVLSAICLREDPKTHAQALMSRIEKGNEGIRNQLSSIVKLVKLEHSVFSDPQANFMQPTDLYQKGYVTFVGDEQVVREIMMDTTEMSPTYSTSPVRTNQELDKKKAEFQAFMVGARDNIHAWGCLLGKDVSPQSMEDVGVFDVAYDSESRKSRPMGKGNLVIGVAKEKVDEALAAALQRAKEQGAYTAVIVISSKEGESCEGHATIKVDHVPQDSFGLVHTVILKQTLNMVSNGAMCLMDKIVGNQMIDVRPSNNKLIDRCVRFVRDILASHSIDLEYEEIYHYIVHIKEKMAEKGEKEALPPTVRIALVMIAKKLSFEKAVEFLRECGGSLEKIFN